ncbi:MMPL family transporter [Oceanobacillus kimchii]|uniref:MMPL family transporter n=1 Tax=Oceanobacillus kimchii TaxID=746691 RepID=UPI002330DBD0|nr:MMPL family transporter [Oceanobacillus kimchii]
MFSKLSKWVTAHPKKIITAWIILLLSGAYFALQFPGILSAGGFNDPESDSMIGKELVSEEFSNRYAQNAIVVVNNNELTIEDDSYREHIEEIAGEISDVQHVEEITTYYDDESEQFISKDKNTTYLLIGLSGTEDEATNTAPVLQEKLEPLNKGGFYTELTGSPALTYGLNDVTKKEVVKAEMIAIPIMVVILLLVFRTVASAAVPLIVAAFALVNTMAVCYFIGQQYTLNILTFNIISMIGLGVVVDYALFIVSRFKNELKSHSVSDAVKISVETSGRAVFYSGITVAISLAALFIPNMMIFNSIALGGVIVVIFAILTSLTLLPSVLMLMGEKINWDKLSKGKKTENGDKWDSFIAKVIKKPVVFSLPAIVVLLIMVWPALQVNMQVPVASATSIPESEPSREGFEVLTASFEQGDIFPIEVIVHSDESVLDPKNIESIDELTSNIESLDGVEEVTSITNWEEDWAVSDYKSFFENIEELPNEVTKPMENLVNIDNGESTSIILVSPIEAADTKQTHDLVRDIRSEVDAVQTDGLSVLVGGETAVGVDFDDKVIENIPYIILAIFGVSFIILIATFRSILIPIKAIVLNAIVTLASVGLLVFVFQNGFSFTADVDQTINSVTPVVLFAVLFGLSMDYEVIIISRMKELHDSGVSHNESIIKGISETAKIVNGAALIMIVVFGAFAIVEVRTVAEIGLGLAFAIFVDAALVRTILVPTLMKLMGRANWWLPFKKKTYTDYGDRQVLKREAE